MKAQELLKASGYDGTPVLIMKPTDLPSIQKLPDVAAQLLRQVGFKVDLQAMDWNTVVSRRAKKDSPAQGGRNMFLTAWVAPDISNPLTNPVVSGLGEKSWQVLALLEEIRTPLELAMVFITHDLRVAAPGRNFAFGTA